MVNGYKKELILCDCQTPEHQMIITYDSTNKEDPLYDPELYITTFLDNGTFFRRLIKGVKYILGHKSKYGHFSEMVLTKDQVKNLRKILDDYLKRG